MASKQLDAMRSRLRCYLRTGRARRADNEGEHRRWPRHRRHLRGEGPRRPAAYRSAFGQYLWETARYWSCAFETLLLTLLDLARRDLLASSDVACHVSSAASVRSGGEVVLAAGAVHSPQLLKLSGIGPRDELEEHGIDVKQDLPAVGANLQVQRRESSARGMWPAWRLLPALLMQGAVSCRLRLIGAQQESHRGEAWLLSAPAISDCLGFSGLRLETIMRDGQHCAFVQSVVHSDRTNASRLCPMRRTTLPSCAAAR